MFPTHRFGFMLSVKFLGGLQFFLRVILPKTLKVAIIMFARKAMYIFDERVVPDLFDI